MAEQVIFEYVERRGRPYPLVPVTLRAREELTLYALVDSGAVVSLFPEDVATAIELDLSKGEALYLTGVGGYIKGKYIPNVEVVIGAFRLRIPIVFVPYTPIELAVLGRKGFFEAFEITFREWERKLIIKPRNI
ncbi:MAG: retropepsin-like domain-containing protein [Desulfurococcales archaeon]|nr:retropepsin-like domain-containing protein [Desulfurococcales archaeon]